MTNIETLSQLENTTNSETKTNSGKILIDRILRGVYKKDVLPTIGKPYTKDQESIDLVLYEKFISSTNCFDMMKVRGEL